MFSGTGKLNMDEGIDISRDNYKNSYMLYAFNLTADLGEDNHFGLVNETWKPAFLAIVQPIASGDTDCTRLRGV